MHWVFCPFFRPMEFSIKPDTIKSVWLVTCIYWGVTGYNFQIFLHFFVWRAILYYQTVHTLMKCCIIQHFICVFTVCKSTQLGVSSAQRINAWQALKTMIYSPKFMKSMGLYFVAVSLNRLFDIFINICVPVPSINRSTFPKCSGMEQV